MNDRPTALSGDGETCAQGSTGETEGARNTAAALRMLGFAKRARKLAVGTDASLNAVRKGKAALVALASDASERTRKQVADKCAFYGVTLVVLEADRSALAEALGSKDGQTSACAVTDRGMAIKIHSLTNT